MTMAAEVAQLFTRDLTRLRQELEAFPDNETLWRTVPGVTNPAGNLALHLEGNLREYIGRQMAGITYQRRRDNEFTEKNVDKQELVARVAKLTVEIPEALARLSADDLTRDFPEAVWGSSLSTRQFLIHLVGHLNYHLGQIDYLRRALTGAGAIHMVQLE